MKTEVILPRPFLDFTVRQKSKCGFFSINDAIKAINARRKSEGKSERRIDKFFEIDHSEYLEELCKFINSDEYLIADILYGKSEIKPLENQLFQDTPISGYVKPVDLKQVSKASKGDRAGTWLQAFYFIKLVRWADPRFEAMVDIWLADNLLYHRNISGDAFNQTNRVLDTTFDVGSQAWIYKAIAKLVAKRVTGSEDANQWNTATKEQLWERTALLNRIENACEFGNFSSVHDLLKRV